MFLLAALSLGFLGSFHCIGMCGPIAMAIPVKRTSMWSILYGTLIYNTGRILTYTAIGFLFGFIGKGFVMAGLQNTLSIALGVILLASVLVPRYSTKWIRLHFLFKSIEKLKTVFRKLFASHTPGALFGIGFLNGLLPCGLIYLGIAGSTATGDAFTGALFMLFFGMGTLPAMLSITLIRDYITSNFKYHLRKVIPLFIASMAILLILRGMNLGIPYISPALSKDGSQHTTCCHKE
ncbi:MAG TPA: sulfite exporter TauE/SafE family protein [Bacteroidia bacterium]|nr:sulfite exporter TauE/SafE family protein [Bacteroidia bacterium]